MKKKKLGKTNLEVTELGLEGLLVSSFGSEFKQAKKTILKALDLGNNFIDTAPGYADSEEVIGKVLKDVDQPLILSTKLGGRLEPFKPQDKDCLRESIKTSLQLLHRDHIDILFIHGPGRAG